MTDLHRRIKNIEKKLGSKSQGTHCPSCGQHDCWKRDEDMKCEVCGPVVFAVDFGGDAGPHEPEPKCQDCGYQTKVFLIDLGGELDVVGSDDEY